MNPAEIADGNARRARNLMRKHFEETDGVFRKQAELARQRRGERSLTGKTAVDYDLNRLRHGAIAQHSFAAPLLQDASGNSNADGDDADGGVPSSSSTLSSVLDNWEPFLSTVVSDKYVRLTPLDTSREGVFWNLVPSGSYSWTAHLGFRVHGAGAVGGDGFALWYQRASQSANLQRDGGAAHGLNPALMHDGIGVIFDSFDNDARGDNPGVTVVRTAFVPRGRDRFTKGAARAASGASDSAADAALPILDPETDYSKSQIGQCYRPFRNTEQPEHVVIKYNYRKQQLQVSFSDQHCIVADNVNLLPLGFFGFSAHTGGVSDTHDVHYFILLSDDDEETAHAERLARGEDPEQPQSDPQPQQVEPAPAEDHGASGPMSARSWHPRDGTQFKPQAGKFNRELDEAERRKWTGYQEPALGAESGAKAEKPQQPEQSKSNADGASAEAASTPAPAPKDEEARTLAND